MQDNKENLLTLARQAEISKNWKEAYDFLTRALEIDSTDARLWVRRGLCFQGTEKADIQHALRIGGNGTETGKFLRERFSDNLVGWRYANMGSVSEVFLRYLNDGGVWSAAILLYYADPADPLGLLARAYEILIEDQRRNKHFGHCPEANYQFAEHCRKSLANATQYPEISSALRSKNFLIYLVKICHPWNEGAPSYQARCQVILDLAHDLWPTERGVEKAIVEHIETEARRAERSLTKDEKMIVGYLVDEIRRNPNDRGYHKWHWFSLIIR